MVGAVKAVNHRTYSYLFVGFAKGFPCWIDIILINNLFPSYLIMYITIILKNPVGIISLLYVGNIVHRVKFWNTLIYHYTYLHSVLALYVIFCPFRLYAV